LEFRGLGYRFQARGGLASPLVTYLSDVDLLFAAGALGAVAPAHAAALAALAPTVFGGAPTWAKACPRPRGGSWRKACTSSQSSRKNMKETNTMISWQLHETSEGGTEVSSADGDVYDGPYGDLPCGGVAALAPAGSG
jgi:hypothetical protein